jgi:hypothetical protein
LYDTPARVDFADDVATVTVSVPSVSRWDEVAAMLQPQFKIDSDTALARVLPVTQVLDQQFADSLSAGLRVGLPTATRASEITETVTNGETERTETSTTSRSSGGLNGAADPTAPNSTALAAAQLAALGNMDPMLQYLAAAALQQEVQLLNRYVADVVRSPGAQIFVVRVPIQVTAHGRSRPYDIETDITLHAEDLRHRARMGPPMPGMAPLDSGQMATGWTEEPARPANCLQTRATGSTSFRCW